MAEAKIRVLRLQVLRISVYNLFLMHNPNAISGQACFCNEYLRKELNVLSHVHCEYIHIYQALGYLYIKNMQMTQTYSFTYIMKLLQMMLMDH